MEVIKETLWKRCLSTPTKPPAKNSNICLSETAYQHKGTRKKCKKTNQAAIIQWQRQCLMDKPKTSDISKQSPSPLHHTFLLGRARFTAQPLSALIWSDHMRDFSASSIWNNMYDLRRKLHSTQSNYRFISAILRSGRIQSVQIFYGSRSQYVEKRKQKGKNGAT